jgi:hypothetical protein
MDMDRESTYPRVHAVLNQQYFRHHGERCQTRTVGWIPCPDGSHVSIKFRDDG